MAEAEVDNVEWLRRKIRVCDAALANRRGRGGAEWTVIEQAIQDVRADAVSELRARGLDVTDEPAG